MGKTLKKGTCLSILPYACPEPVLAKHCHSFTFKQNSNTKNGTELCPQWTSSLEIPLVFNFHATWETNPWMICHAADFEICQKWCFDLNSVDSAKTSSGQTLGNADPLKHARLSWSTRTLRNNRAGEGLASG
jgi:hypothetical protein